MEYFLRTSGYLAIVLGCVLLIGADYLGWRNKMYHFFQSLHVKVSWIIGLTWCVSVASAAICLLALVGLVTASVGLFAVGNAMLGGAIRKGLTPPPTIPSPSQDAPHSESNG